MLLVLLMSKQNQKLAWFMTDIPILLLLMLVFHVLGMCMLIVACHITPK